MTRPDVNCPVCGAAVTFALVVPDDDGPDHATRAQWQAAEDAALLREATNRDGYGTSA